jgi:hypothetical protein
MHSMSFPIIGWQEMPKELTLPEVYANIAESGINVFMTCSDSQEDIRAQLDLAAKHGLQALIRDPRFKATDNPGWQDKALAAVREYGDHPATYGFYVRDEPVRDEFEREGRMVALLKKERPDKVAFVNGLGWGSRGADCFMEYVEDYARIIKPEFLAFDSYPISLIPDDADTSEFYKIDRGIEWPELKAYYRDKYWEAWETYRLVGWKYGLPLSGIVLATPHHHSVWRYGPVTEGTIRLEAFTGLAHGICALQYFTLLNHPYDVDNWDHGILTQDGYPSVRYNFFKNVNRDIAKLGPIVKELTCTRVFHYGPLTSYCCGWSAGRHSRDSAHVGVARVEGDPAILGFLKGNAGRYVMVVNRNPARFSRTSITMQEGWTANLIDIENEVQETQLKDVFELNLKPGDGRLLRLEHTTKQTQQGVGE